MTSAGRNGTTHSGSAALRDDLAFAVVPLAREKGEAILARWDALEAIQGDVYLWRIGQIDAEKAMHAIRDTLEGT